MAEMNEDIDSGIVELGGHIELSGFNEVEGGSMIILKKIIGNYVRNISDRNTGFENLKIHMKKIHETEGSKKFEVHVKLLVDSNVHSSEHVDRNIFTAVDKALRKAEAGLLK